MDFGGLPLSYGPFLAVERWSCARFCLLHMRPGKPQLHTGGLPLQKSPFRAVECVVQRFLGNARLPFSCASTQTENTCWWPPSPLCFGLAPVQRCSASLVQCTGRD